MATKLIPKEEILFAAKIGFLTFKQWDTYFASGSYSYRKRRWKSFTERGYFHVHSSPRARDVLLLNTDSREVISLTGGSISAGPNAFQIPHDEMIANSLLRLRAKGIVTKFETEWELRAQYGTLDRKRNPVDRVKYPDLIISIGDRKIALELELTHKSYKRYFKAIGNYQLRQYGEYILYIAQSEEIFNSIRKAINDTSYAEPTQRIGFVWLPDWNDDPLNAKVHVGDIYTSLGEILAKETDRSKLGHNHFIK